MATKTFRKQGLDIKVSQDTATKGWFDAYFGPPFDWEKQTFVMFEKLIKPGSVFVDIGSWIGTTSTWPLRSCLVSSIHCVEPDPKNHEDLIKNIEVNREDREYVDVKTHRIALVGQKPESGFVRFVPGREDLIKGTLNSSAGRVDAPNVVTLAGEGYDVVAKTFDEFINEEGIRKGDGPIFIKCDVEGAEEGLMPSLFDFYFARDDVTLYVSMHLSWHVNKEAFMSTVKTYYETRDIADRNDVVMTEHGAVLNAYESFCAYAAKEPFGTVAFYH